MTSIDKFSDDIAMIRGMFQDLEQTPCANIIKSHPDYKAVRDALDNINLVSVLKVLMEGRHDKS